MVTNMQYSIVNLSKIKDKFNFKIGAEFVNKIFSILEIKNIKTISLGDKNFLEIIDGDRGSNYPTFTELNKNGYCLFLNASNVLQNEFCFNDVNYITKEKDNKLGNGKLNKYDIVFTTRGTIGNTAYFNDFVDYNNIRINSGMVILRIINNDISHEYFITLLNTEYFKNFIQSIISGSVVNQLPIVDFKEIPILILSQHFQQSIADLVNTSYSLRQSADDLYQEAENILLEELGLKDYKPQNKKCFIKNLSDTQKAGRFDAEYFQPKYEDVIEKIKEYKGGYKILEYFINNYSTGYPYKSEEYQNSGIPVIRIANIGKNKLELENNPTFISEKYSNISTKDIAKAGNILISMSGTIGNVAEIPENIRKCCINQRVLSFESKNINNKYLVLFLNSFFGYIQFEQIGVGGLQINLSYNDIKNLLIPILPPSIQSSISAKVQESFANRDKSKQLLEVAKRGVEIAIEENEESGLKYIERNK